MEVDGVITIAMARIVNERMPTKITTAVNIRRRVMAADITNHEDRSLHYRVLIWTIVNIVVDRDNRQNYTDDTNEK